MLTFGFQRLLLLDVRDVTVSVVIRIMEIGESVVVRRTFNPNVVDADLFVRLQIVIDNHSARTHDGHFTNFPGLKPTALDGGKSLVPEAEGDVGHVLDAWC